MAILKTQFSFFFVLALFGLILILSDSGTTLLVNGQQCHGDLQGLITQCAGYVVRSGPVRDPSQGCCNVVKNVDMDCACRYITRDIEQIIDMEKLVHVAEFCGKSVTHGMKCGTYTVP